MAETEEGFGFFFIRQTLRAEFRWERVPLSAPHPLPLQAGPDQQGYWRPPKVKKTSTGTFCQNFSDAFFSRQKKCLKTYFVSLSKQPSGHQLGLIVVHCVRQNFCSFIGFLPSSHNYDTPPTTIIFSCVFLKFIIVLIIIPDLIYGHSQNPKNAILCHNMPYCCSPFWKDAVTV